MWRHLHFSLKCAKMEHIHLRFFFPFENYSRDFSSKSPFWLFEIFEIPNFSHDQNQMRKWGSSKFELQNVEPSKDKLRAEFWNGKRTEIEYVRFWGISKKNVNVVLLQNPLSYAFWDGRASFIYFFLTDRFIHFQILSFETSG